MPSSAQTLTGRAFHPGGWGRVHRLDEMGLAPERVLTRGRALPLSHALEGAHLLLLSCCGHPPAPAVACLELLD
jgi:hypothetical protein